jgi:hypothetical protein
MRKCGAFYSFTVPKKRGLRRRGARLLPGFFGNPEKPSVLGVPLKTKRPETARFPAFLLTLSQAP